MVDFRSRRQIPTQQIIDTYGRDPLTEGISSAMGGVEKGMDFSEKVRALKEKKKRAKDLAAIMQSPEIDMMAQDMGIDKGLIVSSMQNDPDKTFSTILNYKALKQKTIADNQPVPIFQQGAKGVTDPQGNTVTALPPKHELIKLAPQEPEIDLSTATPADIRLAEKVRTGQVDIRTFSFRGGAREKYLKLAEELAYQKGDEGFTTASAPARAATYKDFTSGKTANNLKAINTGIGHLDTMLELGQAMENNDLQGVNKFVNYVKTQTGNPKITSFDLAKNAVAGEMANIFKTTGATQEEIQTWVKLFSSAQSPEQMQAANKVMVDLMASRLGANMGQWEAVMGNTPFTFIYSKQEKILKKHGFDKNLNPIEQPVAGGQPQGANNLQQQAIQELQAAGAPITDANIKEAMRQLGGQ